MTIAALVIVGCISVFNLVLTIALAKKVSELSRNGASAGGASIPENALRDGSPVPQFTGRTHSGEIVSGRDLTGGRAVAGFFSTTCKPCRDQAPVFARALADYPGGRERVLAVVKGEGAVADELRAVLEPVARVVVEPAAGGPGTAAEAFGIVRWPSYVDIDAEGRITNRLSVDELTTEPAAL
ncbi:TlpA family protein disulfide reductase [Kitasatospora sp. NPDC054939]